MPMTPLSSLINLNKYSPTMGEHQPEAKATVKPDALQTLARATRRLPNRPACIPLLTPEFREEGFVFA
jgi:hypothetical protein